MSALAFVVLVVASLALGEAAFYFVRYAVERKGDRVRQRLRAVGTLDAGVLLLKRRRIAGSAVIEELIGGFGPVRRLAALLEQTDLEWTVARFVVQSAAAALAGTALAAILLRSGWAALVAGALVGGLPLAGLHLSRARRSRALSAQLPDALEMMSRSLRAGHALPSAFQLVTQEMPVPIAVEFGRAFEQQNLGIPFDQAVVAMTERVPGNTDLSIFAVSVLIQRETGGNLVELLEKIAQTIRERDRFYGKLRALTAEGRVGGMILGSLPFVVALLLAIVNPAYMSELSTGLGRSILLGGLLSWGVGVAWMHRIAQVEF